MRKRKKKMNDEVEERKEEEEEGIAERRHQNYCGMYCTACCVYTLLCKRARTNTYVHLFQNTLHAVDIASCTNLWRIPRDGST